MSWLLSVLAAFARLAREVQRRWSTAVRGTGATDRKITLLARATHSANANAPSCPGWVTQATLDSPPLLMK